MKFYFDWNTIHTKNYLNGEIIRCYFLLWILECEILNFPCLPWLLSKLYPRVFHNSPEACCPSTDKIFVWPRVPCQFFFCKIRFLIRIRVKWRSRVESCDCCCWLVYAPIYDCYQTFVYNYKWLLLVVKLFWPSYDDNNHFHLPYCRRCTPSKETYFLLKFPLKTSKRSLFHFIIAMDRVSIG